MRTQRWRWVAGFLAALVLADFGVGSVLNALSRQVRTGEGIGQVRAAVEGEPIDLLVLGSSRARHHIDTDWISEELGIRALNLGANGQGIYHAYLTLGVMLEAGQVPDAVLLQVEPRDLRGVRFERAVHFYPELGASEFLQTTLPRFGKWTGVKLLSRTYRHNHRVFPTLRHVVMPPSESDMGTGFEPLNRAFRDLAMEPIEGDSALIDEESLEVHRALMALLASHELKVIVFEGPRLRERYDGWDLLFREEMGELVGGYKHMRFESWDEQEFEAFVSEDAYIDPAHLNGEAARHFTKEIVGTEAFRALDMGR
ncbi:hypothetical protein EA187_09075 [Lujinxingia sediminis]|uniref:SGNH/GDSL hydrolase family protein n=1 Tax=Lujinxingia sediminis TaxID=2480984 RepID=A0ABY0CUA5_9DELT|nr:hypothetical protein [Lujinxingia sediminis]RVU45899.1 hypothetical protein EA187_09075 [Lujinxingia sediminis]